MKPCYCINPNCRQPDHPDNNNPNSRFCYSCGSELSLNGKYRVSRLLSDDSGFGIVYEVFRGFEAKILKVLQPRWNNEPKAIELFKREYEVLLTLTNQNVKGIPEAEDFFEYHPRNGNNIVYCLVMEKVEGMDLEKWVQQNDTITQKNALKWLKEITLILNKIHQHNWFHRDIKPANIMLRNSGELVLIDFGTAREETQTYYQKMQGQQLTGIVSAGYTPNEQQNGRSVVQSDFFALGRTFTYLLTGKHPSSMYDPYKDKLNWRGETENIDNSLLDFIDDLMGKFPQDRPTNTDAILRSLDNIETKLQTLSAKVNVIQRLITSFKGVSTVKLPLESAQETKKIAYTQSISSGFMAKKPTKFILLGGLLSLIILFIFGDFRFGFGEVNSDIPLSSTEMPLNSDDAVDYYDQGNQYRDEQEYEKALEVYSKAIEIDPDYTDAYYNRGLTHANLEQLPEALADYSKAIEIDPDYINAYNNRGIIYDNLGQYDNAIADYSKAIEIDPSYALAYYNRGISYGYLKQYENALTDYTQAIELNSDDADSYYNRGNIYRNLGEEQSAIADYTQAASLYQAQGREVDYQDAIKAIERISVE